MLSDLNHDLNKLFKSDELNQTTLRRARPKQGRVFYILLSSQNELVDNVKIYEPLGANCNNQIHFTFKVKQESKHKKQYKRNVHKDKYKNLRKYLAKIYCNNILNNMTGII